MMTSHWQSRAAAVSVIVAVLASVLSSSGYTGRIRGISSTLRLHSQAQGDVVLSLSFQDTGEAIEMILTKRYRHEPRLVLSLTVAFVYHGLGSCL